MTSEEFKPLLRQHFGQVHELAYRMARAEADARDIIREAFVRAYRHLCSEGPEEDVGSLLLACASAAAQEQQRARPQPSLADLESLIRAEPTQSGGVVDRLSPRERNDLLWRLKQTCLTAVLNCLPPGERIAFVLIEVLGQAPDEAAATLAIKATALRVRASRARNKVSDYLWPRCEHINPRNPCHCSSRLGVALNRNFIIRGRPASHLEPFHREQPAHDPLALYRQLPPMDIMPDLLTQLLDELESGIWD